MAIIAPILIVFVLLWFFVPIGILVHMIKERIDEKKEEIKHDYRDY